MNPRPRRVRISARVLSITSQVSSSFFQSIAFSLTLRNLELEREQEEIKALLKQYKERRKSLNNLRSPVAWRRGLRFWRVWAFVRTLIYIACVNSAATGKSSGECIDYNGGRNHYSRYDRNGNTCAAVLIVLLPLAKKLITARKDNSEYTGNFITAWKVSYELFVSGSYDRLFVHTRENDNPAYKALPKSVIDAPGPRLKNWPTPTGLVKSFYSFICFTHSLVPTRPIIYSQRSLVSHR